MGIFVVRVKYFEGFGLGGNRNLGFVNEISGCFSLFVCEMIICFFF